MNNLGPEDIEDRFRVDACLAKRRARSGRWDGSADAASAIHVRASTVRAQDARSGLVQLQPITHGVHLTGAGAKEPPYQGRERDDQGGWRAGGMEERSGQTSPEEPERAMDQKARALVSRPQEPHQRRPAAQADPAPHGDGRGPVRWPGVERGSGAGEHRPKRPPRMAGRRRTGKLWARARVSFPRAGVTPRASSWRTSGDGWPECGEYRPNLPNKSII